MPVILSKNRPPAIFFRYTFRYIRYTTLMRYLGIDFGSKRVGLALSDESGTLAFPHSVLINDKQLLSKIEGIVQEQKVEIIVLGESKDFKGEGNPIATQANEFKKALETLTQKQVAYEPEFLTSVQAGQKHSRRPDGIRGSGLRARHRKTNTMLDASAAAIILQSFFDHKS
ncbi:MAG TPA: Holliday junction resolvase RuvX [Candidatus Taylorbacteria bacterium]|nr:MAG: hypothetical protein UY03_C0017G0013 [Parcubacteria group bacterium GW2011_GWA2_47_64]KKU96270.1 MAG: hypothetical protein UY29_C0014G0006 [Parcubacteria group bacterium GW2011_GWC2_48_17]HBV01252.1 Holliday junction resolvase RuvX [Candidatus Taylorbacteria bacterium]